MKTEEKDVHLSAIKQNERNGEARIPRSGSVVAFSINPVPVWGTGVVFFERY